MLLEINNLILGRCLQHDSVESLEFKQIKVQTKKGWKKLNPFNL